MKVLAQSINKFLGWISQTAHFDSFLFFSFVLHEESCQGGGQQATGRQGAGNEVLTSVLPRETKIKEGGSRTKRRPTENENENAWSAHTFRHLWHTA